MMMIPVIQRSKSSLDNFRTMYPHRAVNCLLTTVAFLCLCAVAISTAVVVRQYWLSRVYEPAACRLRNVSYTGEEGRCDLCSDGTMVERAPSGERQTACHPSIFPCLVVGVYYAPVGGGDRRTAEREGVLYAEVKQALWEQGRVCI